jgi:hypothetical protein
VDRVGATPRKEEAVRNFSKPRAVEGSVLLFVILSDPERSEGESKDPYRYHKPRPSYRGTSTRVC